MLLVAQPNIPGTDNGLFQIHGTTCPLHKLSIKMGKTGLFLENSVVITFPKSGGGKCRIEVNIKLGAGGDFTFLVTKSLDLMVY